MKVPLEKVKSRSRAVAHSHNRSLDCIKVNKVTKVENKSKYGRVNGASL